MDTLWLVALSATPFFEARYAIPAAIATGSPPVLAWAIGTASSAILAAVLLLVLGYLDHIARSFRWTRDIWTRYVERARDRLHKHTKTWGHIGVLIFVAIPLPGTGVYSGSVAAYALKIPQKQAWIMISLGAAVANAITTLSTLGAISLI